MGSADYHNVCTTFIKMQTLGYYLFCTFNLNKLVLKNIFSEKTWNKLAFKVVLVSTYAKSNYGGVIVIAQSIEIRQ